MSLPRSHSSPSSILAYASSRLLLPSRRLLTSVPVSALPQGKLIELFAGRRGVLAREASAAKVVGFDADAAGDGFDGQVIQGVRVEFGRHGGLFGVGRPRAFHEPRREQLAHRGHVNAV